jgi:hypothetical protein
MCLVSGGLSDESKVIGWWRRGMKIQGLAAQLFIFWNWIASFRLCSSDCANECRNFEVNNPSPIVEISNPWKHANQRDLCRLKFKFAKDAWSSIAPLQDNVCMVYFSPAKFGGNLSKNKVNRKWDFLDLEQWFVLLLDSNPSSSFRLGCLRNLRQEWLNVRQPIARNSKTSQRTWNEPPI